MYLIQAYSGQIDNITPQGPSWSDLKYLQQSGKRPAEGAEQLHIFALNYKSRRVRGAPCRNSYELNHIDRWNLSL